MQPVEEKEKEKESLHATFMISDTYLTELVGRFDEITACSWGFCRGCYRVGDDYGRILAIPVASYRLVHWEDLGVGMTM